MGTEKIGSILALVENCECNGHNGSCETVLVLNVKLWGMLVEERKSKKSVDVITSLVEICSKEKKQKEEGHAQLACLIDLLRYKLTMLRANIRANPSYEDH